MQFDDTEKLKHLLERCEQISAANELKDKILQQGYRYALSLYGIVTNPTTSKSEYRRIEILSNIMWTGEIVELIYRFFQEIKPNRIYTIWLYDKTKSAIRLVGEYD